MSDSPKVLILMGSVSDADLMRTCWQQLAEFGVESEVRVASAHRTPDLVAELVGGAAARGVGVIIAGAGWAAHLAGAVAANTTLPVIAVPLATSSLQGLDALLSSVQMPAGVPVASTSPGRSVNAAILAAQILALSDEALSARIADLRASQAEKIRNLTVDQT